MARSSVSRTACTLMRVLVACLAANSSLSRRINVTRHLAPTYGRSAPWALDAFVPPGSIHSNEVDPFEDRAISVEVEADGPRKLQTTCSPSTCTCNPPNPANGVYTGTPPDLSACIFGGASNTVSNTWTLTCNNGYYRFGSAIGTCSGTRSCSYSSTVNNCFNTCWYSGPCYWCCICSNTYSFPSTGATCRQCVPPAAPNAINPSTQAGAITYSWSCAPGWWGASVSRTCQPVSDAGGNSVWSGSQIGCTACSAPSAPANGQVVQLSADTWRYSCNPGYYPTGGTSAPVNRVCNSVTGTFSGTAPICSPCNRPGYYCDGTAQIQCPAGTFGLASATTLPSAACSGLCTAGYYCPVGSTSSTAFACGAVNVYCRAGSGAPSPVDVNFYTTPATGPVAFRTDQAGCPGGRQCSGGIVLPGLDLAASCPTGTTATVQELFTNQVFGPLFTPNTPGYSPFMGLTWTVNSVVPVDGTCGARTSMFSFSQPLTTNGQLRVGATALDYPTCQNGFTLSFTVARTNDASLSASCTVAVTVTQVAKPPTITDCAARSVNERVVVGTNVGGPLAATNPNIGTSLLWFVNTTGLPFSIGMCDGQLRMLRQVTWAAQQTYLVPIIVRNDGSSIGIGSSTSSCMLTVNISMVAMPPVPSVTSFFLPELSPVNTLVGNVMAVDPGNFTITNYVWASVDTPNGFAMDTRGNITVTLVADTLSSLKSAYSYRLNVSNRFATSTSTISITYLPVPRPPVTFTQARSIPENARALTTLTPALSASHPQMLNMTFSLIGSTAFGVTPTGMLYVVSGGLDFNVQPVYTITFVVTDTNGQTASSTVTITLIEVNKRPAYCCGASFAFTIDEYSAAGASLQGTPLITASDPNSRDTLTYRIVSSNPSAGMSLVSMDPVAATVSVGLGVFSTGGVVVFDRSLTYPAAQTYVYSIIVLDSGAPQMNATGVMSVQVTNIRPRVNFTASNTGSYRVNGNATIGTVVADVGAVTWSIYPRSQLGFSLTTELLANGDTPFVINATTGVITVANTTYRDGNGTAGAPRWDYNTKSSFAATVTVADSVTSRSIAVPIIINLSHINRPPTWQPVPMYYAPAITAGTVGASILQYVSDPDIALNIGESFNFTIVSGNLGGVFAVVPSTGQLFVPLQGSWPSVFQFIGGAGIFNLTIMVMDAGINGPRYNATTRVQITIIDTPQVPITSTANFSVNELVAPGTVVGYFNASSPAAGVFLTYTAISPAGPNLNRPFPFNISTVRLPGSAQFSGIITVTPDPSGVGIDWNNAFKVYEAVITVTNTAPALPASNTASVFININWQPRPPYFNATTRIPGSAVISLSVPQHSLPGTLVSSPVLVALSKDPWRIPALRYTWVSPTTSLFALNSSTGAVTVAMGAPDFTIYQATRYNMTVMVTDNNTPALTDVASVIINVQETNDPAVWGGIFTPAGAPVTSLNVMENAAAGTLVGFVNASDPNWNVIWSARNYGQLSSLADAAYFTVDRVTGAIQLGLQPLNYWDQTSFTLNVTCTDNDPVGFITVYQIVVINVVQVNTVSVTSFAIPPGTSASVAANSTDAAAAVTALFTTGGVPVASGAAGMGVWLYGTGFGRTARRLAVEGAQASSAIINATFGSSGTTYPASSCVVVVPNTLIKCAVPAGVGFNHFWRVSVRESASPSASMWTAQSTSQTSYMPPVIVSVVKEGAGPADAVANQLQTRGGEGILITGINLGPTTGNDVRLQYGASLEYSTACTVVTAHTLVRCVSTQGIGFQLMFQVTVGGQASSLFNATLVRYATPSITAVYAPPMMTDGSQQGALIVNGTDFGPAGTTALQVTYSRNFASAYYPVWSAQRCTVDVPHVSVVCTPAVGFGSGLPVRITVGGQTSASSATSISYIPPQITQVGGPGANLAVTDGGQSIDIFGTNFGPATPLDGTGNPVPGAYQPIANYGRYNASAFTGALSYYGQACRVADAQTHIICLTAPGTGRNLLWRVSVGEQMSSIFLNSSTNYAPPIVASYSGAGANLANTTGGQIVQISGRNFGPAGTIIDFATYGPNGTEFLAAGCVLDTPHILLNCSTVVGAGAGLSWFVTIDGQRSVAPSTNYGPPQIISYTGIGAVDANTDGGDNITINGAYFSTQQFLNYVTFGTGGAGFTAQGCAVTQNHTAITCVMPPGVGRRLSWRVAVGGQLNVDPGVYTSYAAPRITSITPSIGSTAGVPSVTIRGTNFALSYPAVNIQVRLNNVGVPSPSSIGQHWGALYSGLPSPYYDAAAWVQSLAQLTVIPSSLTTLARGMHQMDVTLPEGFGPDRELFVVINGVPSNIVNFTYAPPVITNIAPDRQNVSVGFLRVIVEGRNFCNGLLNCGYITVNGLQVADLRFWSHNRIMFVMPDPPTNNSRPIPQLVQVLVANVASNVFKFSKPVPNVNSLVGQDLITNVDTLGGGLYRVRGVLDIGTEPVSVVVLFPIGARNCTPSPLDIANKTLEQPDKLPTDFGVSFTLVCSLPAGVGKDVPVVVQSLGGQSAIGGAPFVTFAPPVFSDIAFTAAPGRRLLISTGIPTLGANVTITGRYFGSADLGNASMFVDYLHPLPLLSWTDSEIRSIVPPGDGPRHLIFFNVGGQDAAVPIVFAYTPPTVLGISPATGRTVGGTRVVITGRNFGISQPTVYIGGRPCAVVTPFTPSPAHDSIVCIAPPGSGRDLSVVVNVTGQASPAVSYPVVFTYMIPQVLSVSPSGGPTSGRTLGPLLADGVHRGQGDRINMTIKGDNFGAAGVVTFQPWSGSNALTRVVTVPAADILFWNDTLIRCYVPAGFGDSLIVTVTAGNQSSSDQVLFVYDPPSVVALSRADMAPSMCTPRAPACFDYGNTTQCRPNPAGCYPTKGGFPLELVGASFGRTAAIITIGGRQCLLSPDYVQTDDSVVCMVPTGLGDRNLVQVSVGGRLSAMNNATWFAYDAPVVDNIMPNQPDATGQMISFNGKNFGFEPTSLSIIVGGLTCASATRASDAQVSCTPPVDVVGPKNVSILTANRTEPFIVVTAENKVISVCKQGLYGMLGELCLPCPMGGICPEGTARNMLVDLLVSDVGYWRTNISTPTALCPPERQARPTCAVIVACSPSVACLGSNLCALGYEGDRCGQCLRGKFYRVNNECIKCPDSPYAVFVGFAVILLLGAAAAYFLNKKNVSIALISIGVDYFQVLSMFARAGIKWPPLIKAVFQYLSAFNLNLEIVAPECLMPSLAFWQKWFFIEALPLCAIVLFMTIHLLKIAYKAACRNLKKDQMWAHLPTLISTGLVIYRVLYLYLTRTSLDVMNCAPTIPPEYDASGAVVLYMSGLIDYPCFRPGSMQVFLFPFALCTLIAYSVALPLAALFFLNKHKETIKYDQILRAKNIGHDKLSNPHYAFRKTWHKLYYHFLPGKWYWELVITARKFLVAFVSLMFRDSSSYQMASCLLVLFAAYVLHMRQLPYMSHAQRAETIREHERKVLEGDDLHIRIQETMRAVAKKNTRSRATSTKIFDVAQRRRGSVVDRAVVSFFDYNTVEGVMLAFCILVNILGIMFDSSRFSGPLAPLYQRDYDNLAIVTATVIFVSIVYYLLVVTMDLIVIFAPERANDFFYAITSVWNTLLFFTLGPIMLCFMRNRPTTSNKSSAAKSMDAEGQARDRSGSETSGIAMNPLMTKLAVAASSKGMIGDAGIIDADSVLKLDGLPTSAMWQVVQQSYARLYGMVDSLRAQLRDAKHEQETGKANGNLSVYAGAHAKTRTQYKPMRREEKKEGGGLLGDAIKNVDDEVVSELISPLAAGPDATRPGRTAMSVYRGGRVAARRTSIKPRRDSTGQSAKAAAEPSDDEPAAGIDATLTAKNPLRSGSSSETQ